MNTPETLTHHPDATAPTVTIDSPLDLTQRVPEPIYVIIQTDAEGDIESASVVDGFYYVEFMAYDVAQLLAREQPGSRFFVAVIPDPGVFAFCAPGKLAKLHASPRTRNARCEPLS